MSGARNAGEDLPDVSSERQQTGSSGLTIQHRRIDSLHLDPLNPRAHREKQIAQIAESIRAFGFNVPVLIDDDNKIIAGHGRVLASSPDSLAVTARLASSHCDFSPTWRDDNKERLVPFARISARASLPDKRSKSTPSQPPHKPV